MDKAAMRKHMEDIRVDLDRIEAEHKALSDLLKGYEGWFRVNPENGIYTNEQQLHLMPKGRGGSPLGTVGFGPGAVSVVKKARGEPLRDTEIWSRMEILGVKSNAENPSGWVNRELKKHPKDIKKVGPKTWKWIGALNGHEAE